MRWSPQLVEKERRIWLNVFGIPLHVREEGVLKLIGERYEAFLNFDEDTICRKRLDFARIQVSMARMGWIDEFMTIKVNGVKFHLWVVEEGRSTVVQRRFQPSLAVGDGVSSEGDKENDEYGGLFGDEDESS